MSCLLDAGLAFDCDAPVQGGVERRAIAINLEDWLGATITLDATTNEIETFVLPSTKQGYQFTVPKGSRDLVPNSAFRGVDGVDGYDHSITGRFATFEQLDKETLAKLRWTRTVWVVPLLEGRSQVYGGSVKADGTPIGIGLTTSSSESMPGDASTAATTLITLDNTDSPPIISEPHLIESTFDVDDLLTAAT